MTKKLTPTQIRNFRRTVYHHYKKHGRSFAWRKTRNPYRILVSEIMLQQTQTERVKVKYQEFLAAFPTFQKLRSAPLPKLLSVWQGMGYNRRALHLKMCAEIIVSDFGGKIPRSPEILRTLPGIGPYSASAVLAFAFNEPVSFIETNIRAVFISTFFRSRSNVTDREIFPFIEQTVDKKSPREWYYALMDYGVKIKKESPRITQKSAHYLKQSSFKGSRRELRGSVLRLLGRNRELTLEKFTKETGKTKTELKTVLLTLEKEGFLFKRGTSYSLVT